MPTVAEAVKELENLKHERAVWMEIVEFLLGFVDHEVSKAAQKIRAEECVQQDVPQGVVEKFIEGINEREVEPLNTRIQTLEDLAVVEVKNEAANGGNGAGKAAVAGNGAKKAKKSQPSKKAGAARAKPGGAKKRLRAVPRAAKPKAQGAS